MPMRMSVNLTVDTHGQLLAVAADQRRDPRRQIEMYVERGLREDRLLARNGAPMTDTDDAVDALPDGEAGRLLREIAAGSRAVAEVGVQAAGARDAEAGVEDLDAAGLSEAAAQVLARLNESLSALHAKLDAL